MCEFIMDYEEHSLKAVERGQAYNKFERLERYLFKNKVSIKKKDVNFMKVDNENVININGL